MPTRCAQPRRSLLRLQRLAAAVADGSETDGLRRVAAVAEKRVADGMSRVGSSSSGRGAGAAAGRVAKVKDDLQVRVNAAGAVTRAAAFAVFKEVGRRNGTEKMPRTDMMNVWAHVCGFAQAAPTASLVPAVSFVRTMRTMLGEDPEDD